MSAQRRASRLDGDGASASASSNRRWKYEDVGHQPVGPDHAVGVTERLEALLGLGELHLGVGEVAGLEGDPGQVLMGPGVAALVVDAVVDVHRLVEQPAGVVERAAEHLGEAARRAARWRGGARRRRSRNRSTAAAELAPGRRQVALHLGDAPRRRRASPSSMRSPAASALSSTSLGVGRRPRRTCAARARPRRARAAGRARSSGRAGAGRGPGWRARMALVRRPVSTRRGRRFEQRRDGVLGDRRADAVDRAELGEQLGGGGGVVGDVVDRCAALGRARRRRRRGAGPGPAS